MFKAKAVVGCDYRHCEFRDRYVREVTHEGPYRDHSPCAHDEVVKRHDLHCVVSSRTADDWWICHKCYSTYVEYKILEIPV